MRALFLLLATAFLLQAADHIAAFAQAHNYEISYEAALKKAKAQNRPLMLLMVTHYCPWCVKFEKKTLSNKRIDQALSKKFIKLILNREKHEFPDKFDTPRIPTTYFINSKDESIIKTTMGYLNTEDFEKVITTLSK